jgi:hypothetical protein
MGGRLAFLTLDACQAGEPAAISTCLSHTETDP